MPGAWGGKRQGAGRKKQEPKRTRLERSLSAKLRFRLQKLAREEDAREFAVQVLKGLEPTIIERVMDSGDVRAMLKLLELYKSYGQGPPVQRHEHEVGPSPLAVLQEILRERRERERSVETTAKPLLPA